MQKIHLTDDDCTNKNLCDLVCGRWPKQTAYIYIYIYIQLLNAVFIKEKSI